MLELFCGLIGWEVNVLIIELMFTHYPLASTSPEHAEDVTLLYST